MKSLAELSLLMRLYGPPFRSNFRKLVEPPYIDSIDWSKWHVFWADERVVPKDHVDSNYKLAFDGFLSQVILTFRSSKSWFAF